MPYYGFEYDSQVLRDLLDTPPSPYFDIIGLVFIRKNPIPPQTHQPFKVVPIGINNNFDFFYDINSSGDPVKTGKYISNNAELTKITNDPPVNSYYELEFFNPTFDLCFFLRNQLEPLLELSAQVIISGVELNFGAMAFPYRGNNANMPYSVFTLKAEASTINPPYTPTTAPGAIGTPTTVIGIPCPPYWAPGLSNNLFSVITSKMVKDVKSISPKMTKIIMCGDLESTIRRRWVGFIERLSRELKLNQEGPPETRRNRMDKVNLPKQKDNSVVPANTNK